MSPQGYKNMDLESQDPIFNANLGQDEKLIWTKKFRCSQSKRHRQKEVSKTLIVSLLKTHLFVVLKIGGGSGAP